MAYLFIYTKSYLITVDNDIFVAFMNDLKNTILRCYKKRQVYRCQKTSFCEEGSTNWICA